MKNIEKMEEIEFNLTSFQIDFFAKSEYDKSCRRA